MVIAPSYLQGWGFQPRLLATSRYACSPPHGPRTTAPESIIPNKPKAGHA